MGTTYIFLILCTVVTGIPIPDHFLFGTRFPNQYLVETESKLGDKYNFVVSSKNEERGELSKMTNREKAGNLKGNQAEEFERANSKRKGAETKNKGRRVKAKKQM